MAKHREHLEAVIASARLRGKLQDSGYARVAAGEYGEPLNLYLRVAALRLSITIETVSGDKPRPIGNPVFDRAHKIWMNWA